MRAAIYECLRNVKDICLIYIYISYSRCLQTLTVSFGMAPLSTTVIPVSIIAETMLAQRLE